MKKKLIALGLMVAVTFSSINVTYADDSKNISTVKADRDGKLVTENVSLDAFVGIAPGDSKVEKISIKNESDDLYDFYILQETVKALEETNNAAGGAYKFDIRVGEDYDSSKSLLSKEVGGYDADGAASAEGLSEVNELDGYTFLTELEGSESTYLFIALEVIGEGNNNYSTVSSNVDGSNGLGYTNALGQLKLSFKVESPSHQGEKTKKVVTKTVDKVKTVKKYVKTGDSVKLFVFAGVLLVGVALLIFSLKKSKKAKNTVGMMIALAFMLSFIPLSNVKAATNVTVTFRAGLSGSFDRNSAQTLANNNVQIAADFIKITVEKPQTGSLTVGDVVKSGFGTTDIDGIFGRITKHEDVSLLSAKDWNVDINESVAHNKEYVLKYGVLVDPVMYTVRFTDVSSYDETSGTYTRDVAAPIINYGNVGDVVVVKSVVIGDYATTEEEYSFTLSKDEENIHTFYYAYTGQSESEEEVTYETRYRYLTDEQVVVINDAANGNPNNNPAAGNADEPADRENQNGENGDAADGADAGANGAEDIADEPTPLDGTADGDVTDIEDPQTPYTDKPADDASLDIVNIVLISCISAIVVFIVAVTIFVIYRKKGQKRQV